MNNINNSKDSQNQEPQKSGEELFKTKLHEAKLREQELEVRLKDLENYKQNIEQAKERKQLFKEFMINSDKQKTIGEYINKYNIKDQRSFIEDISKLLETDGIRKSKMADDYFNSYQEGVKDTSLEVFAERVAEK